MEEKKKKKKTISYVKWSANYHGLGIDTLKIISHDSMDTFSTETPPPLRTVRR